MSIDLNPIDQEFILDIEKIVKMKYGSWKKFAVANNMKSGSQFKRKIIRWSMQFNSVLSELDVQLTLLGRYNPVEKNKGADNGK